MRKPALVLLVLFVPALAAAQDGRQEWEFTVTGGAGFASLNGGSAYQYTYSSLLIETINESTTFDLAKKNGLSLGVSVAYFLIPHVGLELGAGSFGPKADVSSTYAFSWQSTFLGASDSLTGSWPATGARLTSVPIFLNVVGRYRAGQVGVFAGAGPALFLNTFKAEAYGLWTDFYHYGEFIDYFRIPVAIDKESWTGFGFDAEAGLEFEVTPLVSLVAQGMYFYCPKKSLAWHWTPGTYNGESYWAANAHFAAVGFGGSLPGFYDSLTGPLRIDPSFFTLTAGLRLRF
jgi:opacity protein-like surface antigen